MAYGVKYRLIFSDVLGYGKKVEILKKDYTGEVLPMIGGAEPVTIKWNSKDDFYSPIIGSQCTLNLMVTADVQYDEFYKFDEREYQIKVSYSKSIPQTYADRVLADGGIYESLECITDFVGEFYTDSTYYEDRVNNDGGIVESLSCVSEAINDTTLHIWDDYWIGFIVVDRYKESMVSTPYPISLNAFDGLGTLDNYTAPLSADDNIESGNTTSDIERISLILQNLNLDIDLIFINDLFYKESDVSTIKFPNTTTFSNYLFELKDGFDTYNAKEQLSLLLTMYNMRIYQSYGKWYIVETSNIFDSNVKQDIINKNENLDPPSNIRQLITSRLKSIQNEFLSIEKFNYLGASQTFENISTLKVAPKELRPINNDLVREYLQPLSEVKRTFSSKQLEKTYWNNNAGFEYGDFNWDINVLFAEDQAEIVENEISIKGTKSVKLTPYTDLFDVKCFTTKKIPFINNFGFLTENIDAPALEGTSFTFSSFVEAENNLDDTLIGFKVVYYDNTNTIYWDNGNNQWTNTDTLNKILITEFNTWRTITKKLKPLTGVSPTVLSGKLDLQIFNTRTGTPEFYTNTYYDNVGIFQDGAEFFSFIWIDGIQKILADSRTVTSLRVADTNYTSKKSYNSILFPIESPPMQKNWYRSRDFNITDGDTTNFNTVSNIANQNIMNDFREFCIRYQGSFRGLNPTPLSLHNKIWFNWPGVLEDEQSSVLDGLVYSVKSNNYKILAHVPNDDNDLELKIKITE